jgi:hypothetical protein
VGERADEVKDDHVRVKMKGGSDILRFSITGVTVL